MSQVDYDSMTRAELKQYFLRHREDKAALQAYLDRINQSSLRTIADPNDPDFEKKLEAAILRQMEAARRANNNGSTNRISE